MEQLFPMALQSVMALTFPINHLPKVMVSIVYSYSHKSLHGLLVHLLVNTL